MYNKKNIELTFVPTATKSWNFCHNKRSSKGNIYVENTSVYL